MAACATSTTTTTTTSPFPSAEVTVGDTVLTVWVGDESAERQQGLRGVEELPAGVEGMLFVFPEPATPNFVMLGAVIPLDVWFFDAGGALVGSSQMEPCPGEPCPRYPPPGPVMWALETPLGVYDFQAGDVLSTSASG